MASTFFYGLPIIEDIKTCLLIMHLFSTSQSFCVEGITLEVAKPFHMVLVSHFRVIFLCILSRNHWKNKLMSKMYMIYITFVTFLSYHPVVTTTDCFPVKLFRLLMLSPCAGNAVSTIYICCCNFWPMYTWRLFVVLTADIIVVNYHCYDNSGMHIDPRVLLGMNKFVTSVRTKISNGLYVLYL